MIPNIVLIATTNKIIKTSVNDSFCIIAVNAEIPAATSNIIIIGSNIEFKIFLKIGSFGGSDNLFAPYFSFLCFASTSVNPSSVESNSFNTFSFSSK